MVQVADGRFFFVDRQGVRVPEGQTPRYMLLDEAGKPVAHYVKYADLPPNGRAAPIHYIGIQGVVDPAPAVGQPWPGQDLQAGLKLIELVSARSYCNQITIVDVRNCDGRISRYEPHLSMYAQMGQGRATKIKFGRLPLPDGDHVVSPERKLQHLDRYVTTHNGMLAGLSEWIDLQRDQLYYSEL
jgi:hypothetical protein